MDEDAEQYEFYEYATEEINVPGGYDASYESTIQTDEEPAYGAKLSVTFTAAADINADKSMVINYHYGESPDSYPIAANSHPKYTRGQSYTIEIVRGSTVPLEINPDTDMPYSFTVDSIQVQDGKDMKEDKVTSVSGSTTKILVGTKTVSTPVSIIHNAIASTAVKVTKKLVGYTSSAQYPFIASADEDGAILEPKTSTDGYTLNDDGTASFSLGSGGTVTLRVAHGTELTIRETSHSGYNVSVKKNDIPESDNDTVTFEIADEKEISIEFSNTAGDPLPSTGGHGSAKLTAFAGALLATAAYSGVLMLFARRRSKKAKNGAV